MESQNPGIAYNGYGTMAMQISGLLSGCFERIQQAAIEREKVEAMMAARRSKKPTVGKSLRTIYLDGLTERFMAVLTTKPQTKEEIYALCGVPRDEFKAIRARLASRRVQIRSSGVKNTKYWLESA